MLLELWQAWCRNQSPGEPIPVTDHPLSEEPFPNVQSELPLTQLHSLSPCHASGHQREEISTSTSTSPLEEDVDCDDITPLPSLLQAEQTKWPSAAPCRSCPWEFSPSWSPSSGHTLIVWCPSHNEAPKTTHSTQGGAAPVQWRVRQSPPLTGLLCCA